MRLTIELHDTTIGTLEGAARSFDFSPSSNGIERFGANSTILSVAVPLVGGQRRDHAGRRRTWFSELLPEGDQYEYLISQAGLRRDDIPAFLARYGRDVAGALQIWDLDDPTEPRTPAVRSLDEDAVRALLEDPIGSPLANDPRAGRSSLGGVQPKVVLVRTETGWAQALGGYPTTHILKPQLPGDNATVIYDEEFGSRIARRMGLAAFDTRIADFAGLPTLVIERFDRHNGSRVHQEDFAQALGARGIQKYQEYGGIVSTRRIADTLTMHAPESELRTLARLVVLAVGVGNLDMHAKNIGLLHPIDDNVELAPAYDVVPQAHLSRDGKLALAINRKYRHHDITLGDVVAEVSSWGVRRAEKVVADAIEELESIVEAEEPLDGAAWNLKPNVTAFVQNLADGGPIGGR